MFNIPPSILVMLIFLGLAILGLLIFGGVLITSVIATFSGSAFLFFGRRDSTGKQNPIRVVDTEKNEGRLAKLGAVIAGAGTFAIMGFGLAYISTLGFIASAIVNLIIWFPEIVSFIRSLFVG